MAKKAALARPVPSKAKPSTRSGGPPAHAGGRGGRDGRGEGVGGEAEPKRPLSAKDWIIIVTWGWAILGIISNYSQMLGIVESLVAGYRTIYSSIWRSIMSVFPPWLQPFDAAQTYDSLTFIAIMGLSLFGSRQASKRAQLYDFLAAGLLSFFLQLATIRIFDRTPYDVLATTTVNLVILGVCLGAAISFRTIPSLKRNSALQWSPLTMAIGTLALMLLDSPALFADTITGDISPTLGVDLGAMRQVLVTALVITNLGAGVFFLYAFHGPRRPLLAYALGLAAFFFLFALTGGIIERALLEAHVLPADLPSK